MWLDSIFLVIGDRNIIDYIDLVVSLLSRQIIVLILKVLGSNCNRDRLFARLACIVF